MKQVKKYIVWCIKGIQRKIKKMTPTQKKLTNIIILSLVIGGLIGSGMGRSAEKKRAEKRLAEAVAKVQEEDKKKMGKLEKQIYDLQEEMNDSTDGLPWNLVLVNRFHPMEEVYVPQLVELTAGYSIDTRIANEVRKMLSDAEKEGLHIEICSAYRSVERQGQVFGQSMKERVKDGMEYWDAYEETTLSVAVPGTSEHALGLALDLISNQYTELDEGQEDTAEAKWLAKNCHKYGFILRYPPEKTDITGIIYEPWHYRYVGENHAAKIMELGITLEEYLQEYYQVESQE